MTKHIFFSGKGGVGKTTMASATAIYHAKQGKKTLIVTTDPAANLSDVFEQEIGHKITPINVGARRAVPLLYAMEINPDEATREYKERIIGPFRQIMPADVIASLEENLSGPCTTEMASFDKFIDFMESDEYDVIVFDTAPTGHTIRLLELPVDWSKHIEEASEGSGQTCLGPVQSIQGSKEKYDRATELLKDTEQTNFIFVMRPDELSLYETLRASKELETIGIKAGGIIINGILPEEACSNSFFRKKFEVQQTVIADAGIKLGGKKRFIPLKETEIKGIRSLEYISDELFSSAQNSNPRTKEVTIENSATPDLTGFKTGYDINRLLEQKNGTKAVFFTGKGGVGKTTISCITAMYSADRGNRTLIVTTDPAAHIGEVFDMKLNDRPTPVTEKLSAVMIDQEKAFTEYRERVLKESAGKYSAEMMATMEEELNSPCIKEMAAFDKFIRFIEGSDYDVIIFDTAPTGHTLRLLELPFDYAKQAEMMISTAEAGDAKRDTENRFRKIIEIIRDRERSSFCLVLYPESTPILESYRAMLDLKDAGIETELVVANMIIPEEVCTNNFFMNRHKMQTGYLEEIKNRFKLPLLRFPLMEEEIKGREKLRQAGTVFQH